MLNAWKWQNELSRLAQSSTAAPRVAIVGVGQALRGDDGAGPAVVTRLAKILAPAETLLLLDAAHAPENLLGPLIRFHPTVVLFIDATRGGEPPGSVYWLPAAAGDSCGGSTHTLPLNVLAEFIRVETGAAAYLLGIEPATTYFTEGLSPPVEAAVTQLVNEIVAYWRRLCAACSAMSTGDVSVVST